MKITAIPYCAPISIAILAAVMLAPATKTHAQSSNQRSLPSDTEIGNLLVEGEE